MKFKKMYLADDHLPLVSFQQYLDALEVKDALEVAGIPSFIKNTSPLSSYVQGIIGEFTVMAPSQKMELASRALENLYEIEEPLPKCPACLTENPSKKINCPECGLSLC